MVTKKGQAAAAASLIAVIGGVIILYILFLQPEDRAAILGEDLSTGKALNTSTKNITLLTKAPGRIDFLSEKKVEHSIPAINIMTQTAGTLLEERDSIYIKKSVFSAKEEELKFLIEDIVNTENVVLSFNVGNNQGMLEITLNGEKIFDKEVETPNIIVDLPKKIIKDDNTIHFSVSSPGAAFWRTNEYRLEDVKVTADITKTTSQRSKNLFILSSTEYSNLDKALLKFQPDCNEKAVAPLNIWVNQHLLYSAVPECGVSALSLEFSPEFLNIGENEIVFSTDKGSYYIAHITIVSQLKQVDFPVYYFELNEEQYNAVKKGQKDVIVELYFVDTVDKKEGQMILNGHITGFNTKDIEANEKVSDDIVRGNNALKIVPDSKTLDIRELKVLLTPR